MSTRTTVEDRTSGRAPALARAAVPIICLAQFMVALDVNIVNVALPSINHDLHTGGSDLAWVLDAYLLTYGGLLLLGGRFGDRFGKRRVFLTGITIFTLASLACGLAPSLGVLIAARLCQGAGAALVSPGTISLIAAAVPAGPARVKAMSLYGAMSGFGSVAGYLFGGILTDQASWRWVFLVNLPMGALLLALVPRAVIAPPPVRRSVNLPAAVGITAAMSAIVYGLIRSGEHGWSDRQTIAGLLGGLVLIAVFLVLERRAREPLVPGRLVRNGVRTRACLGILLIYGWLYPVQFLLVQYLQQVRDYSALRAGIAYLPAGLSALAGAALARGVFGRIGARAVGLTGAILAVAGSAWLCFTAAHTPYVLLLPALVIAGIGVGFTTVVCTLLSTHGIEPADTGTAAGLFATSGQLGGATGVAVVTSIVTASINHHAAQGMTDALVSGYGIGFAATIAAAAAACLLWVAPLRMR